MEQIISRTPEMVVKKEYRKLAEAAQQAQSHAYVPFSKFKVGAALLSNDGKIFEGCNIENSSYGLTICAERVAVFKAISMGALKFKAIAIVSDCTGFTYPCGACRQVLSDLTGNIDFVLMNKKKQLKVINLNSLLPFAFTAKDLNKVR